MADAATAASNVTSAVVPETATAAGGNVLSVSLPTDFLTGSGNNGLNLNFNFGGNASTIADSAYSFLNNSFNNDQAFLGGAITATQGFVNANTAPLQSVVYGLGSTFNSLMPSIVGGLFGAAQNANTVSEQISANSTAASEQASQASIAESKKASGGGGLCFITTAVCGSLNLPDDCRELRALRDFRDTYMRGDVEREAQVKLYYAVAPTYVRRLDARHDAKLIYARMYSRFILPALHAIDAGDLPEAYAIYCALVEYTRAKSHES